MRKPIEPVLINRRTAAHLFDITPGTFDSWDIPAAERRGNEVFYDLKKILDHKLGVQNKKSTPKSLEETRLIKAKADRAELELKHFKNTLHSADTIAAIWTDQMIRFRTRLLSLPSKVGLRVSTARDATEAVAILEKEVRETLVELRDYEPDDFAALVVDKESLAELDDEEPILSKKRGPKPGTVRKTTAKPAAKKAPVKKKTTAKRTAKK